MNMNTITLLLRDFRPVILLVMCTIGFSSPVHAREKTDKSPMLRIVCVDALAGQDDYILASQDKRGKWKEHQNVKLRSSLITPWLAVPREELNLCAREDGKMVSKCTFTYPKGARRVLLVLLPGENKDEYKPEVIDTSKQSFGKGEILVINSSSMEGEVMLGETKVEAKPGESSVHKPSLDDKGMFRMLVTYTTESGSVETCSDNYLPGNETGRDFLFLIPDPQQGLRVSSLPDFGPFE